MERERYEFVLEAVQPIAHHSETIGNDQIAMRRKIRTRDGWAEVPVVTADTMRHGMREAAAYAFLDAADMLADAQLSEAALRLLFAGGMVSGKSGGAVKLDSYREMCELVPSLGLFGGCAQNRVIPGRLTVDDATIVCEETADYCPAWVVEFAKARGELQTHRTHIEETQRVRMDPMLQPQKRLLLTEGGQVEANRRLAASEQASEESDAITKDKEKSTMLPRRFERVCQGSLFSWSAEAIVNTELDRDVFNVACISFLANAKVGGKRATGHGQLRCLAANRVMMKSPARELEEVDATALAPQIGQLFKAHVAERSGRIREFLGGVDA